MTVGGHVALLSVVCWDTFNDGRWPCCLAVGRMLGHIFHFTTD